MNGRIFATMLVLALTPSFEMAQSVDQKREWIEEPTAFRGVEWGSAEKDVLKILQSSSPASCFNVTAQPRTCRSEFAIGTAKVIAYFSVPEGRFSEVTGTFKSPDYDTVRKAFVDKYGPPMTETHEELQTRVGVKYQQETLEWEGQKIHIALMRFGSTVTEGLFAIETQPYRQSKNKAREEQQRKLKDAL